jgi:hypothetical protein
MAAFFILGATGLGSFAYMAAGEGGQLVHPGRMASMMSPAIHRTTDTPGPVDD